ncbi:MAG: diaminopimelate decarboxylase, partial [Elusimicrobia bacterium]|nr:diaminopimelate decarboxylase [Elusimicrobiota bacterium]
MMGHMTARIGGVPSSALAARFGTPLYAYDADALRARLRRFSAAFSARPPLVCYALKANPLKALARILADEGAGCDVVSGGELARALAAGFRPERIVFSGVGKTEDEMRAGLRARIKAF